MTSDQAREIKQRHSADLLAQAGVCGVGVEKNEHGELVLAIHLDSDPAEAAKWLPSEIEGLPVKLIHSGPFKALRTD